MTPNADKDRDAYVQLTDGFASELRAFGISTEVIDCLRTMLCNMTMKMDHVGYNYARFLRQALIEYGLYGVKQQTKHVLARMKMWRGEEARHCKSILRKWIK